MFKKYRKAKKVILISVAVLILIFTGLILFSPYKSHDGFSYDLVKHTVEIDAPPDSVFKFLGNSDNASKWSVYVDHISPINSDSFPDGVPGSRRRCFCNENEQGCRWDELITEVIPAQKRQLTIYNQKDFLLNSEHLATEQIYQKLPGNKTSLTFTVFYKDIDPGIWDIIKISLSAYEIKSVFEKNMTNIKRLIEEKN
jgi:uncharacterized protein YndB with AHSA1/START domain